MTQKDTKELEAQKHKAFSDHKIKVLMIDDQAIIGEAVRRMLVGDKDIEFHFCQDPTKAFEYVQRVQPTVILQDLVMPKIEGLDLVKQFREKEETKNIPMIVLSTKEEPVTKAKSFALGANDYIVKLPDKVELIARIRYHSNGYIHLLQRNEAHRRVLESQNHLLNELDKAAKYVYSLLPKPLKGEVDAKWRFIPSDQLGGDSFGYHWVDEDHLGIYLLDVCGHGVGAALLSVSAMNVLRAQTLPGTDFRDPKAVMEGLNKAFPMENNNNMFFTMWYAVFNKKTRELSYSSGGHPPAVFLNEKGEAKELTTPGLVIGGMQDVEFQKQTIKVSEKDRLYVFSDGVFEVFYPDGTCWTYGQLVDVFKEIPKVQKEGVEHVIEHITKLQNAAPFEDDVSLVEFTFN